MAGLLLLCEYGTLGGEEQSMLSTLAGVEKAGLAPAVAAPPQGPLAEILHARGVEAISFDFCDRDRNRLRQGQLREKLAGLLRRRRPDLLHANSLSMGRLSGPVAAELGVPSLAHLRDIVKISRRAINDLNRHRRLLAVSEATRTFHVGEGLSAEKTHVLLNGVDLGKFRPRPATGYLHHELGIPAAAPLIGNIGQIGLRKAQDILANAAVVVAKGFPDVHYIFVGERFSEKDESRRFESDLRAAATGALAGRFHFLGFRNDVDKLLNEMTLLAHTARQEPLGRVLLESAASGVAVIATDVGGTREIFPPAAESARLVPPDDPETLAAAIADLLGNGPQRTRLGDAARRRAEEAFPVQRAVAGLVEHYWDVSRA